jgi:hypothetical protein
MNQIPKQFQNLEIVSGGTISSSVFTSKFFKKNAKTVSSGVFTSKFFKKMQKLLVLAFLQVKLKKCQKY